MVPLLRRSPSPAPQPLPTLVVEQQNKDAAIRAGKREQWTWMQHEALDLVRAFEKAGAVSLWAWDDLSVSVLLASNTLSFVFTGKRANSTSSPAHLHVR